MISPGIGDAVSLEVAEVYRDAELRILRRIAASLQVGIDSPEWEQLQLGRLQLLRAEILAELAGVAPEAAASIQAEILAAYSAGAGSAYADLGERIPDDERAVVRAPAIALAQDVAEVIRTGQPGILRAADDIYRQVVRQAVQAANTGTVTRPQATEQALGRLLSLGLRGVQTQRGVMDLPTYVTMAVRTGVARSAIAGHELGMDQLGLDLVIIHPGPRACDICDRWARKVLRRKAGPLGRIAVENVRTGERITVTVDDTLAAARAAGWGHPNCRCGMADYLPGVTEPDEIERPPWDRELYEAQQRQRAIERQILAWKRRQQLAMTPEGLAEANAKVRAWQGAMREHLAAFPDLKRQSAREQL